jgi:hypothetical protein
MRDKRRAVLLGIAGVGLAAMLLVTAARPAVYLALAMQGLAGSLIGPGIAAISLALVGQAGLGERVGRNALRFHRQWAGSGGDGSLFLIGRGSQPAPTSADADNDTRISRQGTKSLLLDKRLSIFAAVLRRE